MSGLRALAIAFAVGFGVIASANGQIPIGSDQDPTPSPISALFGEHRNSVTWLARL
jgi:hypothetical protein